MPRWFSQAGDWGDATPGSFWGSGEQDTRSAEAQYLARPAVLTPAAYPETEELPFCSFAFKNSFYPCLQCLLSTALLLLPLLPTLERCKEVPYVNSLCWHVSKRPCQLALIVVTANFHSSWVLLQTSFAFTFWANPTFHMLFHKPKTRRLWLLNTSSTIITAFLSIFQAYSPQFVDLSVTLAQAMCNRLPPLPGEPRHHLNSFIHGRSCWAAYSFWIGLCLGTQDTSFTSYLCWYAHCWPSPHKAPIKHSFLSPTKPLWSDGLTGQY